MELCQRLLFQRSICTSAINLTKKWRKQNDLPVNKTSEGILLDMPDYTFLDGRPTPLGFHQNRRLNKQREFIAKIIEFSSELDNAKQRIIDKKNMEEERKIAIKANRLKEKGFRLLQKNKNLN